MNWNSKLKEQMTVTNHEGAKAYAMTPELELYTAVVTASLSDLCYEKQDERSAQHPHAVARGVGQGAQR